MAGLKKHGWAVFAAIMVLLLAAIFRPELRALVSSSEPAAISAEPASSAAPTAVATAPSSAALPPSAAPKPPPPQPSAAPPPPPSEPAAPRPTTIDGKDAKTWRAMLRGAVMRGDAGVAADSFVALATIDPEQFAERRVLHDGVEAAHLAASTADKIADRVFDVLKAETLGHYACDILYRVTSIHGGSRAAKRSAALLKTHEVLARGTQAMRIALEIRDAPCKSRPALFERAAQHGDQRTLYLLQAMRNDGCGQISCCLRTNAELSKAVGAIRTRLSESR